MSHNWYVIIGFEHLLFKCFKKTALKKTQIPQKKLPAKYKNFAAKLKQNQNKIAKYPPVAPKMTKYPKKRLLF